jgi:hypothetical protein
MLFQDGAGLDDWHELLGEADFALQTGPDLRDCEDGRTARGVDGRGVGEVEGHHFIDADVDSWGWCVDGVLLGRSKQ